MVEIERNASFRGLTPQPSGDGRRTTSGQTGRFRIAPEAGRFHALVFRSGSLRRDQGPPDGRGSHQAAGPEPALDAIHLALKRINCRIWRELRVGALAGCHALLYTVCLEEGGVLLDWREANRRLVSSLHGFETASTDNERYMSLTEAIDRIGQKLQIINEVAALKADAISEEHGEFVQNDAELWRLSRLLLSCCRGLADRRLGSSGKSGGRL